MSNTGPQSTIDLLLECINAGFIDEALFAIELLNTQDYARHAEDFDFVNELLQGPQHTLLQKAFLPVFQKLRKEHCPNQPLKPHRSPPLPPVTQNPSEPKAALSDLEKLQAQCNQPFSVDFSRYQGPS